jgi:hypothetical protein
MNPKTQKKKKETEIAAQPYTLNKSALGTIGRFLSGEWFAW